MVNHFILIFFIAFVGACNSPDNKPPINNSFRLNEDTIDIQLINFHNTGGYDTSQSRQVKLVQSQHGDTILYNYFSETEPWWKFTNKFVLKNGGLYFESPYYELIDSFELTISNTNTIIYKYNRKDPPIDGETFLLMSKDFGFIGLSFYSWGNGYMLHQYDSVEIDTTTLNYLLDDKNAIFREKNVHY